MSKANELKTIIKEVKQSKFLLPLRLQHFSEEGTDGGDQGDESNNDSDNTDDQGNDNDNDNNDDQTSTSKKPSKTFSQDDVNNIAAREAKKAQEKLLKQLGIKDVKTAKQGLEELKKMQDAQKTDAEKALERSKELENQNNTFTQENETLKAELSALKADVNPESVSDVVVLAKNLINDDTNMDEAIAKVLEKYPHFKRAQEQQEEEKGGKGKKKPKFSEGKHDDDSKKQSDQDIWKSAFNWARSN